MLLIYEGILTVPLFGSGSRSPPAQGIFHSKTEYRTNVRKMAGERGIWQRHFWEHCIRDELDFERHVDYVHVNPVKHGLAYRVIDWPYSSFHRYVEKGIYPAYWGGDLEMAVAGDD